MNSFETPGDDAEQMDEETKRRLDEKGDKAIEDLEREFQKAIDSRDPVVLKAIEEALKRQGQGEEGKSEG